jgi:hypothetical protein
VQTSIASGDKKSATGSIRHHIEAISDPLPVKILPAKQQPANLPVEAGDGKDQKANANGYNCVSLLDGLLLVVSPTHVLMPSPDSKRKHRQLDDLTPAAKRATSTERRWDR